MSLTQKLTGLSLAIMAFGGVQAINAKEPQHQKYFIEFTFNETPTQTFAGGVYGQGTYVTKDHEGNVIDPGHFTMIERQPHSRENWGKISTFILCGTNGITTANYKGNSLSGSPDEIDFVHRSGVYHKWLHSKHFTSFWTEGGNYISLEARVRVAE